jgi:hypothetical protein
MSKTVHRDNGNELNNTFSKMHPIPTIYSLIIQAIIPLKKSSCL